MSMNDFLPFAANTGANVQTQADYAASSDRATGYVTGTASSAEVNKVLRQCSLIASMVAQLIVDQTGQNAVDDGTIATLEANLEQAILNIAANRIIQISDVVNLTTTLAGKLDTTGNAASASKLAIARTIALAGIISGSATFDGSGNISIATAIADAALSIAKTAGLQAALDSKAGLASPAFTGNPTSPTQSTADNSTRLATTAFVRALFNSFVQVSPGLIDILGFKIQWGSDTAPASGTYTTNKSVTWPSAFQTACKAWAIAVTASQPQGPVVCYLNSPETVTGATFTFDVAEGNGASGSSMRAVPFNWFVIGY